MKAHQYYWRNVVAASTGIEAWERLVSFDKKFFEFGKPMEENEVMSMSQTEWLKTWWGTIELDHKSLRQKLRADGQQPACCAFSM